MSRPRPSDPDLAAITLLDEPVRGALYEWVVDQGRPVGRQEAAGALGITRALATFHLDRLADAGLLESDYRRLNERRGPGAGRPARVYWRTERTFSISLPGRRYELAAHVLAAAVQAAPDGAGMEVARQAGRDHGSRMAAASRRAAPRRSPAATLREVLTEQGYEPTSGAAGEPIRLRNCPFHSLVEDHRPLVCGMNLAMAEGMAETLGDRLPFQPVLDPQPGYCCVAFTRPAATR